ncbi:MFS transporter [Actinoplanes teichomyceticus]|uniref:EmrB/QacA subfamily drug resistance transporter n=1 Tax=Actinoplanes teichomyceticus TaxID=1867 RepID=A0A561WBF2_ACTTI|nr:MFS transporter [Actinoplanes teichomyceticus]TWG21197.1 EmrB/QacA subfamily drug resistance transporter [Actinoplanes teichomyceticus]GIF15018.1 MFS transporter [Actinoplanes teichomyceticus]
MDVTEVPAGPDGGRRPGRVGGPITLAVIVGFQLMLVVDITIVNVALPAIQRALDFSTADLSWVANAYTLAVGGLLLLGGRAGDVLGRRRVFVAGVVVFTVASLAGGFATDPGWLIATRALQGVGAALAGPSTMALIANNFREGTERHRALGVFAAVSGGGGSLGIIGGGMLTEWASWRWVMFVNVPIGLAILLLTPRFVREADRRPGRLDVTGALLSSVGLTALTYAFIRGASDGWTDPLTLGAFAATAVLLTAFAVLERRADQPILPLGLFRGWLRAGAYLNMFLLAAAMIGVFYFLTLYMQNTLSFSPVETGLGFLAMTVPMFAAARWAPQLLARLGPKRLAVVGTLPVIASMGWLTTLSDHSSFVAHLLGPLLLIGIGVGLTFMPLNAIILATVEPRDIGSASGLLQAVQRVGSSLGLAILVAVAAHAGTASFAGQAARAFQVAAVLAVLALLVTVFVVRPKPAG